MRFQKFATTTIITFLLVVIVNADFGYMAQLSGVRLGMDWQFLPQTQVLAQTAQELKARADELLQHGIQQYQTSQFEAALKSWQEALVIYQKIKDPQSEAGTLALIGGLSLQLEDTQQGIEYLQESLAIAKEINNPQLEAEVEKLLSISQIQNNPQKAQADQLLQQGTQQLQSSQFEAALQSCQAALIIYQKINDRQGENFALVGIGLAYAALGDYTKTIEYYQQSLAITREIKDRSGERESLGNLGFAYYYLGDYTTAIEYYQQSLAIARKLKDRNGEGQSLDNLGLSSYRLGDYSKAIEYHQQSLAIWREINNRSGEGESLNNLGIVYYYLGDYTKAITYNDQSLAIARQINNRIGEGNALSILGSIYHALEDYTKAIQYHQESLAIKREIKDRRGERNDLGNLGLVYHDIGDYSKAIEYHQQSLAIAREIKYRLGEGSSLNNLGFAYYALGDYTKAIEYQEQSLAIARELKDLAAEGITLDNLGNTLFKSGNLPAAEKTLFASINVWESLRSKLDNDNNKVSIFEQQAKTYRLLQQVLVAQNKTTPALEISERGRARAFVELLLQRQAAQGITSSTSSIIPSATKIQQVAQEQNATIVEYSIIPNESLYIWVIAPNGNINFRSVDLTTLNTSLSDLVTNSRASIGVRGRAGIEIVFKPGVDETTRLQQLYQVLIQPIADLLPSNPNDSVIFIPQGDLFLVPFPALKDANNQYLIEKHTILTAPSIQILELTHQQKEGIGNRESGVGDILVVGNPKMPTNITTPIGEKIYLSPLPGAEKEAIAIANLLKTQAITGDKATKVSVVEKMKNARIIHLATHGLLDDFQGLGLPGAIVLGASNNDNGLLTASEIFEMKLKAELVVLSACDTGRGKITGDGVVGLSRSLITAGVPSIIVSLWSVPDDSTEFLMKKFYQNLEKDKNKAQALRQAMLTTMKEKKYPNPLQWAAFTLIGES